MRKKAMSICRQSKIKNKKNKRKKNTIPYHTHSNLKAMMMEMMKRTIWFFLVNKKEGKNKKKSNNNFDARSTRV